MKQYKKAYLEITNTCNLNCSFCHGTKRENRFMSEKDFDFALNEIYPFTDYIYFHLLGEPLTHPKVVDYIKKASEKGFKVTITTNGTLINECEGLLESGVYKVCFSLHSYEEEKGEKNYLEKIVSFAKKASEKGIIVSLRLWNIGSGRDNRYCEEFLKKSFSKWQEDRRGNITLGEKIFLEYAHRFVWPDLNNEEQKEHSCYGLKDQFGILVDGSVVPCCLDAEGDITLGNIFNSPLDEILNSRRAENIRKGFEKHIAVEPLCQRCPYSTRF